MAENTGRDALDDELYDEDDEDTQENRFLTFRLGDEDYGIEIRHVIEIVGIQKITDVPDMPDFVKGVINLRGQVIPVMDVRLRFHMDPRDYDERTCVIVVQLETATVGLVVDTVQEVREIMEARWRPVPPAATSWGWARSVTR
ncbi:MAG: chemotaxis protein CheW [Planctomycetota bacterium]